MNRKLFKYSDTQKFRLKSLENGTVWLAQAHTFNDAYDCHIKIKNDMNSGENTSSGHKISMIRELVLSTYHENDSCDAYHMNKEMTNAIIAWAKTEIDSESLLESLEQGLSSVGILCMAPTIGSKLMWAYYADGLQGFVAEYECNNIQALTVTYSSSSVSNYLSDFIVSPRAIINRIFKTKSIDWSHEDERRLILIKPDDSEPKNKDGFLMKESDCFIKLSAIHGGPKIQSGVELELKQIANSRGVEYKQFDI
jgi:hypothetical protein